MKTVMEKVQCATCHYFIPYESTRGRSGECRLCKGKYHSSSCGSGRWTLVQADDGCESYKTSSF